MARFEIRVQHHTKKEAHADLLVTISSLTDVQYDICCKVLERLGMDGHYSDGTEMDITVFSEQEANRVFVSLSKEGINFENRDEAIHSIYHAANAMEAINSKKRGGGFNPAI